MPQSDAWVNDATTARTAYGGQDFQQQQEQNKIREEAFANDGGIDLNQIITIEQEDK